MAGTDRPTEDLTFLTHELVQLEFIISRDLITKRKPKPSRPSISLYILISYSPLPTIRNRIVEHSATVNVVIGAVTPTAKRRRIPSFMRRSALVVRPRTLRVQEANGNGLRERGMRLSLLLWREMWPSLPGSQAGRDRSAAAGRSNPP